MPVILKAKGRNLWLDEKEKDTDKLQNSLVPYPSKKWHLTKLVKP
jgi:hypothetical protein